MRIGNIDVSQFCEKVSGSQVYQKLSEILKIRMVKRGLIAGLIIFIVFSIFSGNEKIDEKGLQGAWEMDAQATWDANVDKRKLELKLLKESSPSTDIDEILQINYESHMESSEGIGVLITEDEITWIDPNHSPDSRIYKIEKVTNKCILIDTTSVDFAGMTSGNKQVKIEIVGKKTISLPVARDGELYPDEIIVCAKVN